MNRNTTVTLSLALLACAILVGLACAGAPASASISPATTPITIDVDLPSDSTGTPGGALALRIFAPASAGAARYAAGAPVLIYVPGGTDAGTLRPALQQADDVIRIVFLFPGGSDSRTGRSSDGTYDYRGADSIAALRDVIRYAAGELTDAAGHTIDDVVPVPVLHDNIGLLGTSNGGNIIVAVAAEHGSQLAGHLRYIVQWESPVSSQIATVDLGRVNLDCAPGHRQSLLAVNPRYLSYGPLTLDVDYSQLTYDAGDALHPVFFDGTGDGHYTTVLDPHTGCRTPDLNLNGTLELNEDFPLTAYTDGVKHYYSRPVTQALTALFGPPSQQAPASSSKFPGVPQSSPQFPRPKGTRRNSGELRGTQGNSGELGGTPWPPDIATPPEAAAFWDLREAVRLYPAALTKIPDLEGMVLTSLVDHVQTAPDHPHIHQAFDGWDGNGAWVKINPARDYVLEVDPSLSSRTDLPDNAANTAPADWTDAGSYAFPDGLEETYFAAAVHEMADRAHAASAPTPTPTATPSPPASLCVGDVNSNGVGDVVDIMATASDLSCHVYLPLVAARWHQPWPTPTPPASADVTFLIGDPLPDMPVRSLLGVNAGPAPVGAPGNADLTTAYQDIGVTMVRNHDFYGRLDMAVLYPDRTKDPNDPASFDFTASDDAFAAIVEGGFEPYFRIGDSWSNATPPANASERANWVQAAVNVVRHYREGLWNGFDANIRYAEIWNEPDFVQFWPQPHTRLEFFQLYEEAAQALKVAFPDLNVGGPGFSPAGALTPNGQQFVRDFLDYVKNHDVPLDFLSWHLYANDPADFVTVAGFYKNLLDEKGFSNVETHVTEWNTATRDVSPDEAIALRTGARGAALMSAAWIELQNMGVDVATFYRGGDQDPDMTSGYGLFYADARPKKIALAFELWAELAAHPERLVLTPTPDRSLWGIAGRNAAGEIAVLVVNPHDTDTTYRFTDVDGQSLTQYAISISEVNDDTLTTRVFTPTADVIPIGAYTVHLVVLSPAGEPEPMPTATPTATPPTTGDAVIIPIGDANPADPTVKPLLGVISGPDPNAGFTAPNLTTQYQDVGVFSVRNNDYYDDRLDMEGIFNCGGPTYPSWEGCDPNEDTYYNWGPSDAQFASYLNGGFEPFLRLGGEWQNRNHPHDFKGPQNATQEANWIIAAQKVVDRYLHWNGAEKTFTYLDIWTEFPGNHFWDRSNVEFIAFWVRAYASLKGAYPQLKVGGPGFGAGETMKVIQGNAELSLALLTELYNQGLPLDWFGWHLFNNDPTTWTQAAIAYRQLLDGTGPYAGVSWAGTGFFADTEVIVDAYGLSSRDADGSPLPPDERNQLHNGPRGASLLTAAWIAMQYGDVERAYYYRGNDFGSSSPGDGSGGPGLFYSDAAGTYKPNAHAFRLWSQVYRRYPHLLQVALPSAEPQVPLWVLAARNDQGDIALLAANPSADAVTWSPRFADGTTLTDYVQVELYQVDGTNDGRTSTPFTGSAVTTAAYTVQLLVLHPAGNPQIGLNFIRFFWAPSGEPDTTTPYVQPEWIFNDFAELGIHAFASPTLTVRTDYPNSPESQAADVFRWLVQAYGYGDSLAMWHTYIGSPDTPGNDWRLYGIRTDTAEALPSYYTFKLLTTELIPFASVEILSNVPAGENSFKITTEAGDVKYVAWGSGNFAVPAGMTQVTSVIPNADGSFTWQDVEAGDVVTLASEPVLLK